MWKLQNSNYSNGRVHNARAVQSYGRNVITDSAVQQCINSGISGAGLSQSNEKEKREPGHILAKIFIQFCNIA